MHFHWETPLWLPINNYYNKVEKSGHKFSLAWSLSWNVNKYFLFFQRSRFKTNVRTSIFLGRPGVYFTNIFTSSFYTRSSQKCKNSVKLSVSFYAFRIYTHKKAAGRTFMKLTPGVWRKENNIFKLNVLVIVA